MKPFWFCALILEFAEASSFFPEESAYVHGYVTSQGPLDGSTHTSTIPTARQAVAIALALDPHAESVERIRGIQMFLEIHSEEAETRKALDEVLDSTHVSYAFHRLIMKAASIEHIAATIGEPLSEGLRWKAAVWKKFCVEPLKLSRERVHRSESASIPCELGGLNEWIMTSSGREKFFSSLANNEVVL